MDKKTLEKLKQDAEKRFTDKVAERDSLKAKWDEAVTELGRIQGEFRGYENLEKELKGKKE